MFAEQFIMLIAPYPFLQSVHYTEYIDQYKQEVTYNVNDILFCFSFIRSYLFLRCSLVVSKFMNPRSKRVCGMNGCEADLMFAVKAIMK